VAGRRGEKTSHVVHRGVGRAKSQHGASLHRRLSRGERCRRDPLADPQRHHVSSPSLHASPCLVASRFWFFFWVFSVFFSHFFPRASIASDSLVTLVLVSDYLVNLLPGEPRNLSQCSRKRVQQPKKHKTSFSLYFEANVKM